MLARYCQMIKQILHMVFSLPWGVVWGTGVCNFLWTLNCYLSAFFVIIGLFTLELVYET